MLKCTFPALLFSAVCLLAPALLAQEKTMAPPPVIYIAQEAVKPGRNAAHAASEAAWTEVMAKAKSTDHYLGMASMTGPSEAWFLMGYASYAEYEAKQNELEKNSAALKEIEKIAASDGDLLSGTRGFLAAYRKELSYGPDQDIGKMRYFRIRTFRIKQGQNKAFEANLKTAIEAYGKMKLFGAFATFEVTAGMPGGTYVMLRPMKTLADLDMLAMTDKPFQEAMGEEALKALQKSLGDVVEFVGNQVFALSPKLSYPWPSVVASDPAFWTPKKD
jgi:hypothetical protein